MRVVRLAIASVAVGVTVLTMPAASNATFPGTNGKIAFTSGRAPAGTYGMNPDGTGQTPLNASGFEPVWHRTGSRYAFFDENGLIDTANPDGSGVTVICSCLTTNAQAGLAWSPNAPDPQDPAFIWAEPDICESGCTGNFDLWRANSNGTGVIKLTNTPNDNEVWPDWSPDGTKIAFSKNGVLATMLPDGTGVTPVPGPVTGTTPSWSPDQHRLAYVVFDGSDNEVHVVDTNGTNDVQLTNNSANDASPAWSPDGTKIAFRSDRDGNNEIYVMNADGTGQTRLTTDPASDGDPDWQPQYTGYARPKGAGPFLTYLVPAYKPCFPGADNRTHGAPLAFPSCAPPQQTSNDVTVGTSDSNGQPNKSRGYVKFSPRKSPADIAIQLSITDVRKKSDLSDYVGQVQGNAIMRFTDRYNGPSLTEPATMIDVPLPINADCAATADTTVGATCAILTGANTIVPGMIKGQQRTIVELGQVRVFDGGPDGDITTPDGDSLFMNEGLFVP